ncbi:MAG: ABC transporter permease [Candidatus Cloacimonadota bacterium]|nr:ABC transporter permease [Candidatus Cloacimonadota bacterium]
MKSNNPLVNVAKREFGRIIRGKSTRNLLIFVPICVFIFLAFIYVNGIVHNIPVAVYDKDHTELSRTIIRFIEASPQTKVIKYLDSSDKIENIFLKNDEIEAIFVIPKNLSKDVLSGKSTKVGIYTNSSNIIFGNTIYRVAMTTINTVSGGILLEKFKMAGLTEEEAMNLVLPIRVNAKPLYNSNYNYLYYLVPGLLTVLLQMILIFVTTRAINSEFNNHTIGKLLQVSNNSVLNIIIGKAIAYSLMGFLIVIFILGFVFPVFAIPVYGNLWLLSGFFLFFNITAVFFGLMLSGIISDETVALDVAFFYNSPAFVFSGFTFPIFGMPFFDKFYAQLIPYTHFLYGFFKLYQMNVPIKYLKPEIFALLIFFVIGFLGSIISLKIRLKKFKTSQPV